MASDIEDRKQKAYTNRRAISDLGMGIIYAGVGFYFIVSGKIGPDLEFPPRPFNFIFGALCLLYGGFRIYRGIKRNYYK
jgi:hypothetical protein